jgi:hypothetical protein
MTLGSLGTRLGKAWGLGALGFVAAAYGCGGTSINDQNEPPLRGTAGHAAGAAGHTSAGTPGSGGSGGSGGGAAGKPGSGGTGASAGHTGGAGDSGHAGAVGKAGAASGGKGGAAGTANGGGSAVAGEAGMTSGTAGEGGAPACNPDDLSVPFETRCLACATNACGTCLCSGCQQDLQTCQNTPGCEAIAQCVIDSGCTSIDCYCGTQTLVACLTGQSDGPCKDVILSAPGAHEPSAQDLSAGPAADAALAVGSCATSGACAATCQ